MGHTTAYENASTSILLVEGFGIPLPNNQGLFMKMQSPSTGDISSSVEGGFYKTCEFSSGMSMHLARDERKSWQLATGSQPDYLTICSFNDVITSDCVFPQHF